MADQSEVLTEEVQNPFKSVNDQIAFETARVFGRYQLVDKEGNLARYLLADLIEPTVKAAVVDKPSDRSKIGIPPTKLMETHFPDVPGPAEWANYEGIDREVREGVYGKVKTEVLRVLNIQPTGIIQQRLAANGNSLVLARMRAAGGREELFYVTRNHVCVKEDVQAPETHKMKLAMNKAAAVTETAMQRIPEKAKFFAREYNTAVKLALDSGASRIQGALEAGNNVAEIEDFDS